MASEDIEQLVLSISADTAQMRRALKKLEGDTNASTRKVEQQFDRMASRIEGSFQKIGSRLKATVAGFAAAFTFREAQRFIDANTRIENSLKVSGLEGEQLTAVYDQLFVSAQRNAAPLEDLVTLYSRVSRVQGELGVSQKDVLAFADNITVALRAAGTGAEEASGALLQLSQLLGRGTAAVAAEEFNSIGEGVPTILQAVANGIEEAGGSVAKLRALMLDGKLSAQAFFEGFQVGAQGLKADLEGVGTTSDQAFTVLFNAITKAAGKFDDATGSSDNFSASLLAIADVIADFDVQPYLDKIDHLGNAMSEFGNHPFWAKLNQLLGVDTTKVFVPGHGIVERSPTNTPDAIRASAARMGLGPTANTTPKEDRLVPQQPDVTLKPVSIKDYVPTGGKGGGSGRKKSGAAKLDDFDRELKQIRERTAAIQAETAAQAQLNPLINDYGYAAARSSEAQALLTAAKEAGTAAGKELVDVQQLLSGNFDGLSPKAAEQARTMLAVAEGYAAAEAAADKLAEKQDRVRENAEEAAAVQKDLARGVVDGFLEGKSAAEVLGDALSKLGQKFLDLAFDAAFDPKAGGGSGLWSLLSKGIGALFGGGAAADPWSGMRDVPAYARGTNYHPGGPALIGEKGAEVLDLPRGSTVTPMDAIPRMPRMAEASRASNVTVDASTVIHAPNSDAAGLAKLQAQMAKRDAELPAIIKTVVKNRPNERW